MSEHRSVTEIEAETATLGATHPRRRLSDPEAPARLERGANLGRYLILEEIGHGGMGVIYAAYDPDLDRRVALKVLPVAGRETGERTARRLREARALARLNHPNVLAVYDVGVAEGLPFIATELVGGETLAAWLRRPRPTGEILRTFRLAGRGLIAAHAEGLVHRDFKPSNVMIGSDGRVRVVDFGLAELVSVPDSSPVVDVETLSDPAEAVRWAGGGPPGADAPRGAPGTPRYMAPEQRSGGPVGPAADQFSFCVALHRALFGVFPPECGDVEDDDGAEPRWVAGKRRISARVRGALRTGLAEDPDRRHPSMADLLAALTPSPWRGGRAFGALALLLLLAWGGYRLKHEERRVCGAGLERVAEVWGPASRQRLREVFAASAKEYVADAWPATARVLDAYSEDWASSYRRACIAHRRGAQSPELFDLRGECLEQRLRELAAVLRVLSAGDEARLERALEAVSRLTPSTECAEVRSLRAPQPVPAEAKARVAALRSDQAEVRALLVSGAYADGQARAETLVEAARELGHWPLTAEALLYLGRLADAQFQAEAAEQTLVEAVLAAQAGGHERIAAEAFLRLARAVGLRLNDLERARRLADQAREVITRLGAPPILAADLEDLAGTLLTQEARYDAAGARLRRALELRAAALGADHPAVGNSLIRLGNVDMARGELEAARDFFGRALAISQRARGPWHPTTASGFARLGTVSFELGAYDEALASYRRALEIRRRSLGPDHVRVAVSLTDIANVLTVRERYQEALDNYRAALEVFEKTLGPSHGHVATTLNNLATALLHQGRPRQARGHFMRALEMREEIHGTDREPVAEILYNLGETELRLATYDAALRHFRRCHAIWQSVHGADHFLIADAETGIGRALLGSGAPREALTILESALTRRPETPRDPVFEAKTQFALARALAAAGRDPVRARELARAARDNFRQTEKTSRHELDQVETWLAAHG